MLFLDGVYVERSDGSVIPGWAEVLLHIPPKLGYGAPGELM
jgi:hypothetical protein